MTSGYIMKLFLKHYIGPGHFTEPCGPVGAPPGAGVRLAWLGVHPGLSSCVTRPGFHALDSGYQLSSDAVDRSV